MQSQGWKAGQALGAKDRKYADTQAAKLTVSIKDDTLGLGASLKSKDIANQRTGFDAFQGLLGRLNAKDEAELQAVEKKIEDKKLATFAQGRWGGMVFVPGGILVQSDPFKQKVEEEKENAVDDQPDPEDQSVTVELTEKAKRKAEKQQRKEQRRLKKEQKLQKKAKKSDAELGLPTPDSSSANEGEASTKKDKKSKKRARSPEPPNETVTTSITVIQAKPRTGRQLLRGKNILAKRAAFSDMKGLDEIFMRKT